MTGVQTCALPIFSKDALKKYGEDTVNAVGATWKQSDVFGYEVNIAKLEQIKAGG